MSPYRWPSFRADYPDPPVPLPPKQRPLALLVCYVFLGMLSAVVGHNLAGCAQAPVKALTSVEIAEWTLPYGQELDLCRDNAKRLPRAERFDAYVRCEEEASAKVCKRLPASARAHWSQCEVTP